jgi:hypothetical protein
MFNNFEGHVLSIILDSWIIKSSSYKSLCGEYSILRVSDGLSLCWGTNKFLTFFSESNNRWSCSVTFSILDDFGSAAFHNGYTRVGSSKIDTDDGAFTS